MTKLKTYREVKCHDKDVTLSEALNGRRDQLEVQTIGFSAQK